MENISWPQKKREFHSNHFDSTIWNDFQFRDDDIIISTYAKSGTTWVQQIVSQLIFNGEEGLPVADMSPWLDLRVPPAHVKLEGLASQNHRRFMKTHLPVDALVFSSKAKYIYIARDGRDVVWSLYNHHSTATDKWYDALNNTPGLVGPPMEKPIDDVVKYFRTWLNEDGFPFWSFWENLNSWWNIRQLPNVQFIHFANLKKDLEGQTRLLASFLNIPIDENKISDILYHCSFEYMRSNAESSVPLGGILWKGGAKSFIHKGTNGRWKDLLSEDDVKSFEEKAISELGKECAEWMMTGNSDLLLIN